ncbi:hypothetical protein L6452_00859 [Arctium lappa]|uniref:Uncharacterized protein n=1 Tax=Arctium lappa TaxID=4217 RepID=A0ACB9FFH5_ARCLA|nr:hypothetical protein L6452_00859 [Arctium lappa]
MKEKRIKPGITELEEENNGRRKLFGDRRRRGGGGEEGVEEREDDAFFIPGVVPDNVYGDPPWFHLLIHKALNSALLTLPLTQQLSSAPTFASDHPVQQALPASADL